MVDAADCSAGRVSLSRLLGGREPGNVGLCAKLYDLGLTIRDASSGMGTRRQRRLKPGRSQPALQEKQQIDFEPPPHFLANIRSGSLLSVSRCCPSIFLGVDLLEKCSEPKFAMVRDETQCEALDPFCFVIRGARPPEPAGEAARFEWVLLQSRMKADRPLVSCSVGVQPTRPPRLGDSVAAISSLPGRLVRVHAAPGIPPSSLPRSNTWRSFLSNKTQSIQSPFAATIHFLRIPSRPTNELEGSPASIGPPLSDTLASRRIAGTHLQRRTTRSHC